MSYVKKIVCLANSRKTSGRCIAGREVTANGFGSWVRPVSNRNTREVSEEERRYQDGQRATVLDVIKIPMIQPVPHHHHVEDHLIDEECYWEKTGRVEWDSIENLVEPIGSSLWINENSTYHGTNDKISEAAASGLQSSLMLIRPVDLTVLVRLESGFEGRPGKRRVRAGFSVAGSNYLLQVTDPIAEAVYLGRENGIYPVEDAIICVSLSEAWNDHVFKLVAAIFTPDIMT